MCCYAYCFNQTVSKGGLLICYFWSKYKKDPLVAISLKAWDPFCWGPWQLHNRFSVQQWSYSTLVYSSFYNKRQLCWELCVCMLLFFFLFRFFCWFFFVFSKQELMQQSWQFYIFYNALWLLKIKICGKQVIVLFINTTAWASTLYTDTIHM